MHSWLHMLVGERVGAPRRLLVGGMLLPTDQGAGGEIMPEQPVGRYRSEEQGLSAFLT
jgi:hypothetical protein